MMTNSGGVAVRRVNVKAKVNRVKKISALTCKELGICCSHRYNKRNLDEPNQ